MSASPEPKRFRHRQGETISYESSPGFNRTSCARCGTSLPSHPGGGVVFVPAGCLEALETTLLAHIFFASRVPRYESSDDLPTFDAYAPGFDLKTFPSRENPDPPSGARGNCLCGEVRYVIEGPAMTARHCHCSRCRRGRAAAHASNLVAPADGLRWTTGRERIRRYKVPEARDFTQSFCERCGSTLPTVDDDRNIAIVPLGGLDDPPPITPQEHIFTADIPAWSAIHDALSQREGKPPD